ncbi:MAG: ABC transporter ATP-binding protein [Loktanella sp.]|jgi:putative ABC transport system ATP-binding protein|nr:ABC transporter ATP-binding protein [Loktanella sp.]MDO7607635.1 ABC transporter ATP-binding protein [Loktanella sp.]MDO7622974.1 ABC transporter ATP-binding protein [Loktanella sp.]MDO7625087.1 ABC transporter ATP-binding protein [Loktanella sp.]MDO7664678.1 ABC transporter ATP-binding protein [Loktanella sp.]
MLLRATNVQKTFQTADGDFDVLRGVDLSLEGGETLALTGESGSGKSTLLHLIGGLDVPNAGQILIDGTDIAALDDKGRAQLRRGVVGVVFQQFNLIPSLKVRDNIAFQARLAGRFDPDWTADLTARLGLTEQLNKYPEQLSGGQQQRVAIARTLAPRPRLVLADEPTGNLDEATAANVLDILLKLVAETGAGLLMVTHSTALAGRMSRRLHLRAGLVA